MEIKETTFPAKTFLAIKKSIDTTEISNKEMYDEAGKKLGAYMQNNGINPSGAWSVLYFMWDEPNNKTDIAIGFPVENVQEVNDHEISLITVPESKAAMCVLKGPYSGLSAAHGAMMEYASKFTSEMRDVPVMAVEEYAVDPTTEPNEENLVTNIYYLHN